MDLRCPLLGVAMNWWLLNWRRTSSLSAMFSDNHCGRPLSSGRHRFQSLWDDFALFDLMLCHPVCSTDVFGCFHQPHREGGKSVSSSCSLGVLEVKSVSNWNNGTESNDFEYALSSGRPSECEGSWSPISQHRELELTKKWKGNVWSQKLHSHGVCVWSKKTYFTLWYQSWLW